MHSSEPIEPYFVNDPRDQTSAGESWRDEVASRVNSYRARKNQSSDENSSEPYSAPVAKVQRAEVQNSDAENLLPGNREARSLGTSHGGGSRSSAVPARNAFDTNYYRRLNAESIAQSAYMTMGRTGAATAPALELPSPELEAEFQAEREAATREKLGDNLADDLGHNRGGEVGNDPALDLEIRPRLTDPAESAADNSFLERYCISESEPELESPVNSSIPQPALPTASSAQGNLIVFRRPFLEPPLVPQPSRDELADPVNRRPRILEVPEDIMPTVQASLFPEIRLDADEQEEASDYREPEFEVPLRVARVSERLIASFTDMGVVIAAGLLFAAIAWRALPEVPHTKPFFMVLGAVTLLLWSVYQHLFLLYAGRTPGMCLRGIRLSTFDGRVPEWRQRGSRARFMFISFASVALGFLWALVDEDKLCWHDRISKTFLTTE